MTLYRFFMKNFSLKSFAVSIRQELTVKAVLIVFIVFPPKECYI